MKLLKPPRIDRPTVIMTLQGLDFMEMGDAMPKICLDEMPENGTTSSKSRKISGLIGI